MQRDSKGKFSKKTKKDISVEIKDGNYYISLEDDTKISGPVGSLESTIKRLNLNVDIASLFPEKEYWKSESRGYVKYSDMATSHLKNVVAKQFGSYIREISKNETGEQFYNKLLNHQDIASQVSLLAALLELRSRKDV